MDVNDVQVAGSHYKGHGRSDLQHWDVVHIFKLDYYQGNITKYVFRWREKGGVTDLHKALHYLQKYITLQGQEFNLFGEPAPAQQGIVHVGPAESPFAKAAPDNNTVSWTGYHNIVKPTGWWGFTFEGADASGFMYQCDKCKVRFSIGQEDSPVFTHKCPEPDGAAGPAYVDQDREWYAIKGIGNTWTDAECLRCHAVTTVQMEDACPNSCPKCGYSGLLA